MTPRAAEIRRRKEDAMLEHWALRWCADCPEEDGETIFELADYRVEHFATEADAKRRAAEVVDDDFFGQVQITHWRAITAREVQADDEGVQYFDKHAGQWWGQIGRDEYYTVADLEAEVR